MHCWDVPQMPLQCPLDVYILWIPKYIHFPFIYLWYYLSHDSPHSIVCFRFESVLSKICSDFIYWLHHQHRHTWRVKKLAHKGLNPHMQGVLWKSALIRDVSIIHITWMLMMLMRTSPSMTPWGSSVVVSAHHQRDTCPSYQELLPHPSGENITLNCVQRSPPKTPLTKHTAELKQANHRFKVRNHWRSQFRPTRLLLHPCPQMKQVW